MEWLIILLQFSMVGSEWILGLGIVFGLAFVFAILTKQKFEGFIIFVVMFMGFGVWSELLPIWTLIIGVIGITGIVYLNLRERGK